MPPWRPARLSSRAGGLPAWSIVLIACSSSLAGAAALLWWRRRDTVSHDSSHGAEGAWQRLNWRLRQNGWPASATPIEATSLVLHAIRTANGRPVRPESVSALLSLSAAVSDERYAPRPTRFPRLN